MAMASLRCPNAAAVLLVGGSHLFRKKCTLLSLQATKGILPSSPIVFAREERLRELAVSFVRRRNFSIRATNEINNPGLVDSNLIQTMEKKIKELLDADYVTVKDAYGDGRHVSIDVISSAFEGQSTLNRQRMVYKAIWDELQNTVHAVDQMTTMTPLEASK